MRDELTSAAQVRERGGKLAECVMQSVDLRDFGTEDWATAELAGAHFLGCLFDCAESEAVIRKRGGVIFPRLGGVPYNPYRSRLYTAEELYAPAISNPLKSFDRVIYEDYLEKGKSPQNIVEALARRIHDHAIDDALSEFLNAQPKLVGIIGGAGRRRTDPWYRRVLELARLLTQSGFAVVTGGGPGMMEAANLGAYLARRSDHAVDVALEILAAAPDENAAGYVETAFAVKDAFPDGAESLAAPAWAAGHEATNVFATHIAKYFVSPIREDGFLAIARFGIVFTPGSAGTRQEIFQDAARNHYATYGVVSPLAFLGVQHFREEAPVYPLLEKVAHERYRDLLFLSDDAVQVVEWIKSHPPVNA